MTPGLSQGQVQFVPGTKPGSLLILHSGSPVYPRDKRSLSVGEIGVDGLQKNLAANFSPYAET